MSTYQIPLSSGAQMFPIRLGDRNYRVTLLYRDADGGGWFLDLERTYGSDALRGMPLIVGVNLLEQYGYKQMGGALWCELPRRETTYEPSFVDMGQTLSLFWSDE